MPDATNQPGESTLKQAQSAPQGQSDDPRQAKESGEPQIEGRTHGHVVDEKNDANEGAENARGKVGDNEDWESGRQQAI